MLDQKNVVVIGVGSIASKIAARVKENSEYFNALILSFIGIGLDEDANKFEGLMLDKLIFYPKDYSFERWSAGIIIGGGKGFPEIGRIVRKADYVLILTTGQSKNWTVALKIMEILDLMGIRFTVLNTYFFGLQLLDITSRPSTGKDKAYKKEKISEWKDIYDFWLKDDFLNVSCPEVEERKWQSMVEETLEILDYSVGKSTDSNLFDENFPKFGLSWYWCGSISGNDRAYMLWLEMVKDYVEEEVYDASRVSKVLLYIKADNLADEEVQVIKEWVDDIKTEITTVFVSKRNCPKGLLTVGLFYRRR